MTDDPNDARLELEDLTSSTVTFRTPPRRPLPAALHSFVSDGDRDPQVPPEVSLAEFPHRGLLQLVGHHHAPSCSSDPTAAAQSQPKLLATLARGITPKHMAEDNQRHIFCHFCHAVRWSERQHHDPHEHRQ